MENVIGPVIKEGNRYKFHKYAPDQGVIVGFGYQRIEDAYYALKAENGTKCSTLDEFNKRIQR